MAVLPGHDLDLSGAAGLGRGDRHRLAFALLGDLVDVWTKGIALSPDGFPNLPVFVKQLLQ
jgi:hypothetical protein